MRDDKPSERWRAADRIRRMAKAAMTHAADEELPPAAATSENEPYQQLLRPDYEFPYDVNAMDPLDVILQSGCTGLADPLA